MRMSWIAPGVRYMKQNFKIKMYYQDVHEVAAAEETLPSSQAVHADEAVVEYLPASLSGDVNKCQYQ